MQFPLIYFLATVPMFGTSSKRAIMLFHSEGKSKSCLHKSSFVCVCANMAFQAEKPESKASFEPKKWWKVDDIRGYEHVGVPSYLTQNTKGILYVLHRLLVKQILPLLLLWMFQKHYYESIYIYRTCLIPQVHLPNRSGFTPIYKFIPQINS